MTFGRQIRTILRRLMRQELIYMHFAFPAIVIEYLDAHPDPWGAGATKGVLKGRAIIQPKYKRYRQGKEVVEMPRVFDVPVSWYRMGGFLFRFPLHKGDIVMCIVSERALDHLLTDRETAFHANKEICRLDDAVILPFGLRTDADPLTPDEYTDDLYIAAVSGPEDRVTSEGVHGGNDPNVIQEDGQAFEGVAPGDTVENMDTGETGTVEEATSNPGWRVSGCRFRKGDRYRTITPARTPLAKFIICGNSAPVPGEVKFVTPQFTVISPSIDLGDYGGPNVARVGDTGCTTGGTDPVGGSCRAAKQSGCGEACIAEIARLCKQGVPGAELARLAFEHGHPEAIRQIEAGAEALDGGIDTWKSRCDALLGIAGAADLAGGPEKISAMTGGTLNKDTVSRGIVNLLIRAAQSFLALPGGG